MKLLYNDSGTFSAMNHLQDRDARGARDPRGAPIGARIKRKMHDVSCVSRPPSMEMNPSYNGLSMRKLPTSAGGMGNIYRTIQGEGGRSTGSFTSHIPNAAFTGSYCTVRERQSHNSMLAFRLRQGVRCDEAGPVRKRVTLLEDTRSHRRRRVTTNTGLTQDQQPSLPKQCMVSSVQEANCLDGMIAELQPSSVADHETTIDMLTYFLGPPQVGVDGGDGDEALNVDYGVVYAGLWDRFDTGGVNDQAQTQTQALGDMFGDEFGDEFEAGEHDEASKGEHVPEAAATAAGEPFEAAATEEHAEVVAAEDAEVATVAGEPFEAVAAEDAEVATAAAAATEGATEGANHETTPRMRLDAVKNSFDAGLIKKGWRIERVLRASKGGEDLFFYDPHGGRYRSRPEVQRALNKMGCKASARTYEVEAFLERRVGNSALGDVLVKWVGYEKTSWEPAEGMQHVDMQMPPMGHKKTS